MAAGQGFKTFTTGEVLTAADVNGYLMQGVLVFASEAARDAAITSPQEGQFAYTKDNNSLWYYTGSAWAASGATGDIEGVTAGVGISGGGTSGTVTITNSMATAIDAKGDLVAGTGADTFSRLAVGANNTVLTADSTAATGLKWAAAAGGGKILQVIQTSVGTAQSVSSSTWTDITSMSATITPSATSSKVLVMVNLGGVLKNSANASNNVGLRIVRGSTTIYTHTYINNTDTTLTLVTTAALNYIDSPSTTSATTYKVQFNNAGVSAAFVSVMAQNQDSSLILMEVGA